jgi:cephalosporin hydroxylase
MAHDTHGSTDIIADFHTHIKQYDVEGYSHLVQGYSRDAEVVSAVKAALGNRKLGLLFLDADGLVDKDFQVYGDLLQPGTYLVVDDYFSLDEWTKKEKTPFTKLALDELQKAHKIECFGVYGWGTWVGRIR